MAVRLSLPVLLSSLAASFFLAGALQRSLPVSFCFAKVVRSSPWEQWSSIKVLFFLAEVLLASPQVQQTSLLMSCLAEVLRRIRSVPFYLTEVLRTSL